MRYGSEKDLPLSNKNESLRARIYIGQLIYRKIKRDSGVILRQLCERKSVEIKR